MTPLGMVAEMRAVGPVLRRSGCLQRKWLVRQVISVRKQLLIVFGSYQEEIIQRRKEK